MRALLSIAFHLADDLSKRCSHDVGPPRSHILPYGVGRKKTRPRMDTRGGARFPKRRDNDGARVRGSWKRELVSRQLETRGVLFAPGKSQGKLRHGMISGGWARGWKLSGDMPHEADALLWGRAGPVPHRAKAKRGAGRLTGRARK